MDDAAPPEREYGDPLHSAFTAEIELLVERIRELTAEIESGKRVSMHGEQPGGCPCPAAGLPWSCH